MTDYSGLQIDVRCIKCGRLPTADITLFEMQNHLYICNVCRQQAEHSGKQIRWVNGSRLETSVPGTIPTSPLKARVLVNNLPPNSLFAMLNLPLTASIEEIEAAIGQRMRQLLREEDSPERTQRIEQLHEWQDTVEDPETLEKYKNTLKPTRHSGQALSVGGRLVYNAEEFLSACEDSREGWADGERYLRMGQLQHWIIFQIEDRDLASKIRYYQNLRSLSNFRAFNEALYCLVPERPFRLYSEDVWQPLNNVPSASTPEELTRLCDIHWMLGEHHLYEGSLGYWLEQSRGISGLKTYYKAAVEGYASKGKDRGVGLELLLERAVPTLPKPNLVVTFDGTEGNYTLNRWDRELPHRPITVKVMNTTRGFTSIDMVLEQPPPGTEPQWIMLNNSVPVHVSGTPGDGAMPATKVITLMNLQMLGRGRKYQRMLTMKVAGAYGQPPPIQKFPITLRTLSFFRGLRGILWRWGLRGGLVGFAWNFATGALLAFLLYLLIPAIVPASYLYQTTSDISFSTFMQNVIAGTVVLLSPLGDLYTLGNKFPLIVGAITGLVGFGVGIGKGHTDYSETHSVAHFRTWTFWLTCAFVVGLLIWDQGGQAISQALQYGSNYSNGSEYVLRAFLLGGGSIMLGILTFIIACIVTAIRYRVEKYLRKRYKELLNPPGRA